MDLELKPEALDAVEERLEAELQRRQVRKSFPAWARYKGYRPAKHHMLIMESIQDFLSDPSLDILLIHSPPGSAKSSYVSLLLPPWFMSNNPTKNILFATHSDEFSSRWGRRVRRLIADDGDVLQIKISALTGASDRFELESGGEYYSTGAGAGISGFRADLGLFDDLFGSREDAWSDTVRQKRWDWFLDDFSTRLKPGAKRIGINTRWHQDDVAGKLVEQIEGGQVRGKIIDIRAIAEDDDPLGREPGEYLWNDQPDYDYPSTLRARQREVSPLMWSALFQQRPAPEDGSYFLAEWLKPYTALPPLATMKTFIGCDFAVTSDAGDFSVIVVVGLDPEGKLFLLDLWRKQASSDVWVEVLCDMILRWKPQAVAQETGQIRSALGPHLTRRMRERRAYAYMETFPTRGDKSVRARSAQARMSLEGLYVPTAAPWYPAFRAELLSFPAGRHDDQVDALGLCGQLLDKVANGTPMRTEEKKPTELAYVIGHDGRVKSNMSVFQIVEAKRRKRQAE